MCRVPVNALHVYMSHVCMDACLNERTSSLHMSGHSMRISTSGRACMHVCVYSWMDSWTCSTRASNPGLPLAFMFTLAACYRLALADISKAFLHRLRKVDQASVLRLWYPELGWVAVFFQQAQIVLNGAHGVFQDAPKHCSDSC